MPSTYVTAIASTLQALRNCENKDTDLAREWADNHRDRLNTLVSGLPSGSGWDCGTHLDFVRSTPERLVFTGSFHHMNQDGFYDGWTSHTIVVTPSLVHGFDLRVTGRNRNQIKEYLWDLFHAALTHPVAE